MNSQDIKIINQYQIKKLTDKHLAQVCFTSEMPTPMFERYIDNTTWAKQRMGRIKLMEICDSQHQHSKETTRVFGVVSHGYGYGIEDDIYNSIMKGNK